MINLTALFYVSLQSSTEMELLGTMTRAISFLKSIWNGERRRKKRMKKMKGKLLRQYWNKWHSSHVDVSFGFHLFGNKVEMKCAFVHFFPLNCLKCVPNWFDVRPMCSVNSLLTKCPSCTYGFWFNWKLNKAHRPLNISTGHRRAQMLRNGQSI